MREGDRTQAERVFQQWLDGFRAGEAPSVAELCGGELTRLRPEVERMIADYEQLREQLGDAAPSFEPGRQLDDFRLVRQLGRGGMGVVWEAEQLSIQRRVAVKLLLPHFSLSDIALERFQREAEAGGRLAHPGIVQVHAIGESDGVHYMAQELVPNGFTLADSLVQMREEKELPTDYYIVATRLLQRVAEALSHAHAQGVVHRDVKPANILITDDDQPKLADFGLATIEEALDLSVTGDVLGTPYYMSPEQARAERREIDHRTDIFSLGATMFETLTLQRPFDGDTRQQVIDKILREQPPDPKRVRSRIPRDLATIALKALEKRRDDRYSTMNEMAEDLRRFLGDEPIAAHPPGPVGRAVRWSRRRPALAVTAGLGGVAALAVSLLLVMLFTANDALTSRNRQLSMAQSELSLANEHLADAREGDRARAEQERERAEAERVRADMESRRAYAAQMKTVDLALRERRVEEARAALAATEEERRGWEWRYFQAQLERTRTVVPRGEGAITCLAVNAENTLLASGSADGEVAVIDVATGERLWHQGRTEVPVVTLAFGGASRLLVAGYEDGSVSVRQIPPNRSWRQGVGIWQSAKLDAAPLRIFFDGDGDAATIVTRDRRLWSWTPQGLGSARMRVVSSTADGSFTTTISPRHRGSHFVHLPLPTKRPEASGEGPWGDVVAFAGARSWVSSTEPRRLIVTTPKGSKEHGIDTAEILLAEVDARGRLAAVKSDGETIFRDDDMAGWRSLELVEAPAVLRLDVARPVLYAGSSEGRLWAWDLRPGGGVAFLLGHKAGITSIAQTPDGRWLATGAEDGSVRIWQLDEPVSTTLGVGTALTAVHLTSDGGEVVFASSGSGFARVKLQEGGWASSLPELNAVTSVEGDGTNLAATREKAFIIAPASGQLELLDSLPAISGVFSAAGPFPCPGHGKTIVSGTYDGEVTVRDPSTGQVIRELAGALPKTPSGPAAVAVSDDGRWIAAGLGDGSVSVWEVGGFERRFFGREHRRHVVDLDFSPDGTCLASASEDGTARIWDVDQGVAGPVVEGHDGRLSAVEFLDEGERIVTAGRDDRTVRVWDARSGQELAVLREHGNAVTCLAVSDHGKTVASGSRDGKLWIRRCGPPVARKAERLPD